MRRVIGTAVLVSLSSLGGCAVQAGADGEAVGASEDAITFTDVADVGDLVLSDGDPPPPTPAATLVLYSEAGFWGDTLVQNATPATNNEAVNLIKSSQIDAANLSGRISSFRLLCGTRDAYVVLFGAINNGATLHDWSEFSKGHAFSCKANQTLSVNLHQQAPELADRVASIYLVSHARQALQVPFSSFVASNWNQGLTSLPDGASADGGAQLKLDGDTSFTLRQFLRVDAWQCEERGAIFGLRAIMNQDRTFTVSVIEVYVDTGWGDAWGCRSKMTTAVRNGAQDAAKRLATGLHDLSQLAGQHPRYYFVPGFTMREFDLVGGGDPPLPPLVRTPKVATTFSR